MDVCSTSLVRMLKIATVMSCCIFAKDVMLVISGSVNANILSLYLCVKLHFELLNRVLFFVIQKGFYMFCSAYFVTLFIQASFSVWFASSTSFYG